mmetsp:Transcript_38691/g.95229  ORF Transcript_38691/g.95229 Transcript_38691/m.95229 type:complete len:233 (+) Transcript_38691:603-1301(+)
MALAADMAEESLRALMMAAPRSCTVLMNSPCSHGVSPTASITSLSTPPTLTLAKLTSGYWVDEWLPQIVAPVTAEAGTRMRMAICDCALLASSRVSAVKFSAGMLGAHCCATHELVLAGLPTTTTFTFLLATSLRRRPCTLKMLQFFWSRSLRSMPGPRGKAPSMTHTSMPEKAALVSAVTSTSTRRSNPQSCSSILTPSRAGWALSMSSRWRMILWSGPKVRPRHMWGRSE